MNRRQNRDWRVKAVVTLLSGVVAGSAAGLSLGYLGETREPQVRGAVLGLTAMLVVLLSAVPRLPLPQWNHETPQGLLELGGVAWAAANGALLGIGVASRIGFAIWYLVPAAAFAAGSGRRGAFVYGLYAITRLGAVVTMAGVARLSASTRLANATVRLAPTARAAARAAAVPLGIVGAWVGLAGA